MNPAIRHELPTAKEPTFLAVKSSEIPEALKMVVTSSTDDLKEKLKEQFPRLQAQSASLELIEEEFIRYQGSFYRRVWFEYGDETTWSMHGSCSQAILLWFDPSGSLDHIFVSDMSCPI